MLTRWSTIISPLSLLLLLLYYDYDDDDYYYYCGHRLPLLTLSRIIPLYCPANIMQEMFWSGACKCVCVLLQGECVASCARTLHLTPAQGGSELEILKTDVDDGPPLPLLLWSFARKKPKRAADMSSHERWTWEAEPSRDGKRATQLKAAAAVEDRSGGGAKERRRAMRRHLHALLLLLVFIIFLNFFVFFAAAAVVVSSNWT